VQHVSILKKEKWRETETGHPVIMMRVRERQIVNKPAKKRMGGKERERERKREVETVLPSLI